MRASATREKLNNLVYLTFEKIVRSVLTGFILRKLCYFSLPVNHINNDIFLLLPLAMESETLASFLWQGRKVYKLAAHI